MRLYVVRQLYSQTTTIGRLLVEDGMYCYTLEDVVRDPGEPKVPGKTAIPAGHYALELSMSTRFKRIMPLLLNVPGFSGVRIHGGNTAEDTEGCLIVAFNRVNDTTVQGTAEKALTSLLQGRHGPHYIDILDTHHTGG
jgi:hypothetical protein